MEPMKIYKDVIYLKTGQKVAMVATVKAEKDENHTKVSLAYEGYISKWEVLK